MKILAIDLGKYNSVACLFDTATNQSEFKTIATQRWAFQQLLNQTQPEQDTLEYECVIFEYHVAATGTASIKKGLDCNRTTSLFSYALKPAFSR